MSKDLDDITALPDEIGIVEDSLRSSSWARLPEVENGTGEDLARSEQHGTVTVGSRRYGKPMTVVAGLDPKTTDPDDLASTLKPRLAVGGTVTDSRIQLQGEHGPCLRDALEPAGFRVDG